MAKSILIADDDALLRNALKEIFEFLDCEVFIAFNCEDGVASYRRIATDIVVTDICMPVKDRLETIREINKEFHEAKLIAMSDVSKNNTDTFRVARYLGAVDCIGKPFESGCWTNDKRCSVHSMRKPVAVEEQMIHEA